MPPAACGPDCLRSSSADCGRCTAPCPPRPTAPPLATPPGARLRACCPQRRSIRFVQSRLLTGTSTLHFPSPPVAWQLIHRCPSSRSAPPPGAPNGGRVPFFAAGVSSVPPRRLPCPSSMFRLYNLEIYSFTFATILSLVLSSSNCVFTLLSPSSPPFWSYF